MLSWKTADCLAAGNTVAIKPAQVCLGVFQVGPMDCRGGDRFPVGPSAHPELVPPQGRKGTADEGWPSVGSAHSGRVSTQQGSAWAVCSVCPLDHGVAESG